MRYSVAIPPSNYSQSGRDGWFVISFTHIAASSNPCAEMVVMEERVR